MGRDDVGRLATVGDDAVNAGFFPDMLAERVNSVKGENHSFQSINAQLGVSSGMRGFTEKLHIERLASQGIQSYTVASAGVDYHRSIQSIKGAFFRHSGFAGVDFFGGSAENDNAAGSLGIAWFAWSEGKESLEKAEMV